MNVHGIAYFFEILKVLFSLCFLVQYALHLKSHFQQWRKNPHWSFSCCLALLLPLNDLQGDIRGLAATDVLKTQLESGNFEVSTVQAAVQDSGVIDVTLEEVEEGDDDTIVVKDSNWQVTKKNNTKCEQATQTEYMSFLTVADVTLHVSTTYNVL